jgi:DNA-binding NtrC family response regulator
MAAPPRGLATLLSADARMAVQIRGYSIEVVDGPDAGRVFRPKTRSVVIGTDPSADVPLADPYASRLHARIDVEPTGYLLRDLGSRNGTRIADVWIREALLGERTTFVVGGTTLAFALADEPFELALPIGDRYEDLLGSSAAMREVFAICERAAPTNAAVLLVGETGTGKELVARAIHARSARKDRPFVVLDCAALSPTLVESELFGHEKGAFTNAIAAHAGVFERADGGTVFLDELGELPPDLQPKLLRCLETGEVRRLGGTKTIAVDTRIVAATNRDLAAMIAENRFRADLYYRLAVVQIAIPPLRARREDIGVLAQHFAARARKQAPAAPDVELDRVLGELADYSWPGNVRELRNLVERAVILAELPSATPRPLGAAIAEVAGRLPTLREARTAADRAYVEDILRRTDGDLDRAAEIADVHRKTLERMLRERRRDEADD